MAVTSKVGCRRFRDSPIVRLFGATKRFPGVSVFADRKGAAAGVHRRRGSAHGRGSGYYRQYEQVRAGTLHLGGIRRALQNRSARRHLHGGDAPAEEHHESVTVPAAKHAGIVGKGRDSTLNKIVVVDGVGILERDVHTFTAVEPDTQHNRRHDLQPRLWWCSVARRLPVRRRVRPLGKMH